MATFLEIATPLAKLGIPVFPLVRGSKVPPSGLHFKAEATADLQRIAEWNLVDPDYNVALLARPHEFCFLEFDVHGGMKAAAQEMGQEVPKTRTQKSGRGFGHYIFRQNDQSRKLGNRSVNLPEPCICDQQNNACHCGRTAEPHHHHEWFSFRGKYKYLVGAGSLHPDTHKLYETRLDVAPLEFPGWLADYVEKHSVPEDDPSAKKPVGSRGVSDDFDFDDFAGHYDIAIDMIDDPWQIVTECPPGSGRMHEHSVRSGFYWDGQTLGWNCFAQGCPLHNDNLLRVYGKKGISGFLLYMNDEMRSQGGEPYREVIWDQEEDDLSDFAEEASTEDVLPEPAPVEPVKAAKTEVERGELGLTPDGLRQHKARQAYIAALEAETRQLEAEIEADREEAQHDRTAIGSVTRSGGSTKFSTGEFSAGSRAGISGCVKDAQLFVARNERQHRNRLFARGPSYTCVRGSSSIGEPFGRPDGSKKIPARHASASREEGKSMVRSVAGRCPAPRRFDASHSETRGAWHAEGVQDQAPRRTRARTTTRRSQLVSL
jgi:hypothetical protein